MTDDARSEAARPDYDEFGLFHENAAEFGLPFDAPPVVRRESVELDDSRTSSALVWGESDPELVLLHGGAQNAHTWDTVAMALGRPLVAIDLPGHGHSDEGRNGSLDVAANAPDLAAVIRRLAPGAKAVVGMSLGGLSTLALAAHAPELVRTVVLVDVTPGVNEAKTAAITAFVNGPESFEDFDALLARTIQHNPTRTMSSLRRGILHNAVPRPDGSWVWRYARMRSSEPPLDSSRPAPAALWDVVSGLRVPLMLVRAMTAQSVVDDADEAELLVRAPHAVVAPVADAGHSVQGDRPIELARLIADFVDGVPPRRA